MAWQRLAAARVDVQVILRHLVEHDGLALDRALAHQPLARQVVVRRAVVQTQTVAAQQVEAMARVVEGIEQAHAGLAQRHQFAGQPLRELLVRGGLQQHMRNVRHAGADPGLRLGIQRHLLEHLQRAGNFTDLVAAVEPADLEIVIAIRQPRHQVGKATQRPGHQLRGQPDHGDAEQDPEQDPEGVDPLGGDQGAVELPVARRQQPVLRGHHLVDDGVDVLAANRAVRQIVRLDMLQFQRHRGVIGALQPGDRVDRVGLDLALPLGGHPFQRIDAHLLQLVVGSHLAQVGDALAQVAGAAVEHRPLVGALRQHVAARTDLAGLQGALRMIEFEQHLVGVRRPMTIAFLLVQRVQGDQAGQQEQAQQQADRQHHLALYRLIGQP